MAAAKKAGHVVTLPSANTIADGTAVKTVGEVVFPYANENVDEFVTVEDNELVTAFLDMVENHKMVAENSGLLAVAALRKLDYIKGKRVVCVISGGNMDVITMSSVIQNGLILRDRIFTVSVLLPDRPGQLAKITRVVAEAKGNVIKLEHNQFVTVNRNEAVELRVTMEAFGTEHKNQIIESLRENGFDPKIVKASL